MPISGNELLVLLVLAALLIGPERLPRYAEQVARLVRDLRRFAAGARARVASELGPEYQDVDWSQFDPRRYDPRRIVAEALREDSAQRATAARDGRPEVAPPARPGGAAPDGAAPFDDEAT